MTPPVSATLDAVGNPWDVIVIGAGPAGALVARQLARGGQQTLLIDAKCFPRPKVCGGCLNERALAVLAACGLEDALAGCGPLPIDRLQLSAGRNTTLWSLPRGAAVCRANFDAELVRAATAAGATFVGEAPADVEPGYVADCRPVTVRYRGRPFRLLARQVICADGLSRSSLRRLPEFQSYHAPSSRIGVGAIVPAEFIPCRTRTIEMLVVHGGYVGRANLAGDRVAVAAALDAAALANCRPGEVVARLLAEAGVAVDDRLAAAAWHGTPPLTSHPSRVAARRLFLIGDAAGFVEPFTGEGMAAALESAAAVAALMLRDPDHRRESCAAADALAAEWTATHKRLLRRREIACRALAWMLRRPAATAAALAASRRFPFVARAVIASIHRKPKFV